MITYGKFDKAQYRNSFVVTDSTVAQLYKLEGDNVFVLPQGEQSKSFVYAEKLCCWLLQHQADKSDTLVAVGGGCVGDIAGFVASVYKRGMKLLYVPTTLLAMVDSAIGGKTAINLNGIKNAVGTFADGNTFIDIGFLNTLPQQAIASGIGEIKKYCMLSEKVYKLYCKEKPTTEAIIKVCAEYKESVVKQDKYDTNVRRKLNLGHTVAHALELKQNLPHGIAVEYGLTAELNLAVSLGLTSADYCNKLVSKLQLPNVPYKLKEYIQYMQQDKKNTKGGVTFCLPTDGFETVEKVLSCDQLWEIWQC